MKSSFKKTRYGRNYPVATVGALVFNPRGECLLVLTHKWGFLYGIPGGKIENGETATEALVREFKEETGLKITPGKFVMLQEAINPPEFYKPHMHFLLLNYVASTRSSKVYLNDEAVSYLWTCPQKALKLPLNQPTRVLIKEVLKQGFVPNPKKSHR